MQEQRGTVQRKIAGSQRTVDVLSLDGAALEATLDTALDSHFAAVAEAAGYAGRNHDAWRQTPVIVVLNPDKRRMQPERGWGDPARGIGGVRHFRTSAAVAQAFDIGQADAQDVARVGDGYECGPVLSHSTKCSPMLFRQLLAAPRRQCIVTRHAAAPAKTARSAAQAKSSRQEQQAVPCRYTWAYGGHASTATFIAAGKYAVLDLSAGPCHFGPLSTPSGAVRSGALPRIAPIFALGRAAFHAQAGSSDDERADGAAAVRRTWLQGQLSATLAAAVRHLILPDAAALLPRQPQDIVVAVLVLRNHQRYNPIDGGLHGLGMARLRTQLSVRSALRWFCVGFCVIRGLRRDETSGRPACCVRSVRS